MSCGSNAFGQLNHAASTGLGGGLGGDSMSSLLKSTILPLPLDGTLRVEALACGTNISAAIVCHESDLGLDYRKSACYVWGAGLPGPPLRVPTPLNITDVRQISCGHTHCGLVTESGMVFTWGDGDQGMLGHGNRQTMMAPRAVEALVKLKALAISCGAYHTGIIACNPADLHTSWMRIPVGGGGNTSPSKSHSRSRNIEDSYTELQCGDLYTCGMNKVGQLGHGGSSSMSKISSTSNDKNRNFVAIPKRVSFFDTDRAEGGGEGAYTVAKVSCGMHHTIMLCVPLGEGRQLGEPYRTSVYSCGWGEHGRLGTGDEEQRTAPTRVDFPLSNPEHPFCALEISAGEQHSLAAGREGAYSWGSNSMGQLGAGSPSTCEMALSPLRIPLPEGMEVRQLAAGGRHSAAITRCGKLLSWGWGEEGQLGGGNEKNAVYPRPVRIPKLRNETHKGVPVAVAVGMSHTVVMLKNEEYVVPPLRPLPVIEEITEPPPTPPVATLSPVVQLKKFIPYVAPEPEREPEPEAPKAKKSGLLFTGEEEGAPMVSAVRSIRELLQQREGRSRPQSAQEQQEEGSQEGNEPAAEEEEIEEAVAETSFAFFLTEQED